MGSSIIKKAWCHSKSRPGGSGLNLDRYGVRIWWQGYSGMKIWQLRPKIEIMATYEHAPAILIIHCAGNDIGRRPVGDLRRILKSEITKIQSILPQTIIVWSQILPRKSWRYSNDLNAMNRSRLRLNSAAAVCTTNMGGGYIRYPDLKLSSESLWANDGVHLSDLGNDLLLNTIQGGIECMVLRGIFSYP